MEEALNMSSGRILDGDEYRMIRICTNKVCNIRMWILILRFILLVFILWHMVIFMHLELCQAA